jgi:hypothetical protein
MLKLYARAVKTHDERSLNLASTVDVKAVEEAVKMLKEWMSVELDSFLEYRTPKFNMYLDDIVRQQKRLAPFEKSVLDVSQERLEAVKR